MCVVDRDEDHYQAVFISGICNLGHPISRWYNEKAFDLDSPRGLEQGLGCYKCQDNIELPSEFRFQIKLLLGI